MAETIVISKTIKNETAKILSTGYNVPANLKGRIELIINLDPVELLDTSRSFWFHLYDANLNQHILGAEWKGGANFDAELGANIAPRIWIDAAMIAGKRIRAEIDIPKPQKIGFTLKVIT